MMTNEVENWVHFLLKLSDAKKAGVTKGISVPAITRLIYAGAFDSMIPDDHSGRIDGKVTYETYEKMHEEVKRALKSKASLPKASKTQSLGIDSIDSNITLLRWRAQASPTFRFNLSELYKNNLENLGFIEHKPTDAVSKSVVLYKRDRNLGKNRVERTLLIRSWEGLWSLSKKDIDRFLVKSVQAGGTEYEFYVAFLGFVTEKETRFYSENAKEMLRVKLYLGEDHTDYLIKWPEWGHDRVSESVKMRLDPRRPVLVRVKPTIWKDKYYGGSIVEVEPFTL